MIRYVYGQNEIVGDFVAQRIPHAARGWSPNNIMSIGVIEGEMLIAGVIYHNYDPEAGIIELSAAALPGHYWLTRDTLKHMFGYPFKYLKCQMVVQRMLASDERLQFIMSRYGSALIRVPRMFGRDQDGVLALLTDDAWAANKFNARLKHHLISALEEAA